VAQKRIKAKKKKKAKKMAKKLLKKKIKKEQAKYTHSGYYEVPHNYAQFPSNHHNEKFYFVHLGKLPHFDGKDYPKWSYDMQMHLYGVHPSHRILMCSRIQQSSDHPNCQGNLGHT
jgi:hypothetical protein